MSIAYYHELLADTSRIRSFRTAITNQVGAGDTVLEVGTGLGTFAQFAARAGASQVWAVDADPVVHVAEALAQANDQTERITWLRGWIPEVDIQTPATVLIFEDFVTPLLDANTYRMLRDASRKYLAPGARMIPGRASVYVAPLASEELRGRLFPMEASGEDFELDWSTSLDYLRNLPRQQRMPSQVVVGDPVVWYRAEFPVLPAVADMARRAHWSLEPGTAVHGLGVWFDLDLDQGQRITNAPGDACGPWGQLALPLDPPVVVDDSGRFDATIGYDPTPDGAPGWLRWQAHSGSSAAGGHEFAAEPASLEDLLASSETSLAAPSPTPDPTHA